MLPMWRFLSYCKKGNVRTVLFFTDLDNTVIYSNRHTISDPMVWVETLNGRQQSFVSERTYNFYESQKWLEVIPVTTRTYQQYDRLKKMRESFGWRHALICNGAILLEDGKEDIEWTKNSTLISETDRPAFIDALQLARQVSGDDSVVSVAPFMFYVKTDDVEKVYTVLSHQTDRFHLSILRDARKVYCIPNSLSKGTAAERYMARYGHDGYIAAGDSDFDIPMLKNADICFCPDGISPFKVKGMKKICTGLFSDGICDELERLRKEA